MSVTCVIIGEDTLTFQCADTLLDRGHEILLLVSAHPEAVSWGAKRAVKVLDSGSDMATALAALRFDYLFSIANLRMLPKRVVEMARVCAINFHDGPLPRYAGIHATSWALINREPTHGIVWHSIGETVDGGMILKDRVIPVSERETAFSLNAKCFIAGIESFPELVDELDRGTNRARAQDFSQRSYYGMWQRPDAAGIISWERSAEDIDALVRALDLGPQHANAIGCAKVALEGGFLICGGIERSDSATSARPGTITAVAAGRIHVAASNGQLELRGLATLSGHVLTPDEVAATFNGKVGTRLPDLGAEERAAITRLNAELCRHETFWRTRLAAMRPTALPYFEKEVFSSESGALAATISIDAKTAAKAKSLWQGSLADILAAAFALFMARLSGEHRFDLGLGARAPLAASGRTAELVADEVPWALDVDTTAPVRVEMSRALEALAETRANGTYLRELWARTPELRAIAERAGIPELSVRVELAQSIDARAAAPAKGVAFTAADDATCRLTWAPATLKREAADRILRQFVILLDVVCAEADKRVPELPLMSTAEREHILFDWNATAAPLPDGQCIHQLFEEQVDRTPEAIAVVFEGEELSYAALNERANRLARHLREQGVGPDVIVGLFIERSIDMVVALLGILKAGGAYLPLDPTYPKERLAFIVEDSMTPQLIAQDRLAKALPSHRAEVCWIDRDWPEIAREEPDNARSDVAPHHLAYVIYTSGSTGKPKGVMVEHRNVVSFFTGMDDRLPHRPGDVWLAVTSLSFDISVLELLWSLCRGLKVVVYADALKQNVAGLRRGRSEKGMGYSLFYFSADQGENPADKYRLLIEGAKFADENGFVAVSTPERHFHEFGGLYPNPAVTSAALAMITQHVQLRSGSVVAPLHSPIRIAEEWSVVDNLSRGRVAISFASGWMPNDFVIRPDDFQDKKDATFRHMQTVRRLWRGESVDFPGPLGKDVSIRILPSPIQPELPVWVTTAGNPETYEMAAAAGANVLTHLLGQSIDEVGEKIALYRKAWRDAGHAGRGHVTLMLHTFVSETREYVQQTVREPLIAYLRTSAALLRKYSWAFPTFKRQGRNADEVSFDDLEPEELEQVLAFAFDRYFETSGLFGTPASCVDMVETLKAHDVDEIACLIDFGVPTQIVLDNLRYLNELRAATSEPLTTGVDEPEAAEYGIAALLRRQKVTHLQCTPSMARMLVTDSETREALRRLEVMMIGGEAFPTALANDLKGVVNGRIINMYGPTETTIWSGTHELQGDAHAIPIGRPILNTQFYVVNEALHPQPVGVPGELLIGGAGVARGYLNRRELTAARFLTDPFRMTPNARVYRTGDLVRYVLDGNVEFLGRLDYQVKIRGHRIELGEIEAVLSSHPAVREAVVLAREDTPGDLRLVAYVTTRDALQINAGEIRDYVGERLPEYMVPARVVRLDAFPQTPNKKVDRKALPPPDADAAEAKREFEAPMGDVECKLAQIWGDLLGIREIGRKDDFFELGGDSLSLVQVTATAASVFGTKLSIGSFIEARSLERVAKVLESRMGAAAANGKSAHGASAAGVKVRRMCEADVDQVVAIHQEHFAEWRVTILGRPFLRKMYEWFIHNQGDLALVAEKGGRVTGFTVGTIGSYKRSLFRYAMPEAVRGVTSNPVALARNFVERIKARSQPNASDDDDPAVATNRIMAVSKADAAGGLELLAAFEKAAEDRGTRAYFHDRDARHF